MPLPLRILVHDGEPAYAVFARLASRHGECNLRGFAARVGLSWSGTIAGIEPSAVAALNGTEVWRLARFTPRVDPRTRVVQLADQKLLLNDWSCRRRRYCAECFRDDRNAAEAADLPPDLGPWHRSWWDIRSYDACHKHSVTLRDDCPSCNAPLGWTQTGLDRCPCGADLCATETMFVEPGVSKYIARRLGLTDSPTYPILEPLDLHDSLAVLARLGFCRLLDYCPQRPRASAKEREVARRAGLELAHEWPNAFESQLDRLVKRSGRESAPAGMIGAYGWIYSAWATTEAIEPFSTSLRDALRTHAIKNAIVQEGETLFGERFAPGGGLTDATRRLGSSYRLVRRAAASAGALPNGLRRGVATDLPQAWLEDTLLKKQDMLNLNETAAALGVGRARLRGLTAANLLSPVTILGSTRYHKGDIVQLLAKIRRGSPERSYSPTPGADRLPHACRIARVSLVAAVGAILSRQVVPCSVDPDAPGLDGIIVRYRELRASARTPDHVSVEQAAVMLHLHADSVRVLVSAGEIASRLKTPRVCRKSVLRFKQQFTSNADIATRLRNSPRSVLKHLRSHGIKPIWQPPYTRDYLFFRLEVEGLIVAQCGSPPPSN